MTPERLEEIRKYVDTPIVLELLAEVDRLNAANRELCDSATVQLNRVGIRDKQIAELTRENEGLTLEIKVLRDTLKDIEDDRDFLLAKWPDDDVPRR